jgi:hypothetical protein
VYKIIPYSEDLDLSEFYSIAAAKGFNNNSSKKTLVDSFQYEKEKQVWILYYNSQAVGSVAAHSFDSVMGENSYRICARTCVFSDKLPLNTLRTLNEIKTHQHVTAQFFIPTCIEWAGIDRNLYITSNDSPVGTQRLVHRIFGPALEKTGVLERIKDVEYRGHMQTVWKLNSRLFLQQLEEFGKW